MPLGMSFEESHEEIISVQIFTFIGGNCESVIVSL